MAIRQERIIAQINASVAIWKALRTVLEHNRSHLKYVQDGSMDPIAALRYLAALTEEVLIEDYVAHINNIAIEYNHFRRTVHHNEKRAAKAEEKRRAEGARPVQHVHTFFETSSLTQNVTISPTRQSRSHSPRQEQEPKEYTWANTAPLNQEEEQQLEAQYLERKRLNEASFQEASLRSASSTASPSPPPPPSIEQGEEELDKHLSGIDSFLRNQQT